MPTKAEVLGPAPSNDGKAVVETALPYIVKFTIEGTAALLFHRWSNESVAAKAKAAKNSVAKKTDDVASYVWRDEKNRICLPGEYVRGAMVAAAKFKQDPRSSRKSAMDLYKAAITPLTELASLGKADWDYLDERRVKVQQAAVTRMRPAFLAGWKATFEFQCGLPEYIGPSDFLDTLALAGRVIGVGDFRPTFGRFQVTQFDQIF